MAADLSNPIINSPYDPPEAHFEIGPNGPTGQLLPGRRPSESHIPVPVSKKGRQAAQLALDFDITGERREQNSLIKDIRREVELWRGPTSSTAREPGARPTASMSATRTVHPASRVPSATQPRPGSSPLTTSRYTNAWWTFCTRTECCRSRRAAGEENASTVGLSPPSPPESRTPLRSGASPATLARRCWLPCSTIMASRRTPTPMTRPRFASQAPPVLVDNAATAVDLVFHAERWYYLISPASLGRSWIWSVRAGKGSTSGSSSGARSIMPWPWWLRPLL
jgi:hypothetical protein